MTTETPKPGIYPKIPFHTYLAWDAISNSKITLASRSLWHFNSVVAKEPTKALKLGSFIHCGVLEPSQIAERYAVMPAYELDEKNITKDGERTTSAASAYVKDKRKAFAQANSGKTFVTPEDYDTLVGVSRAIAADLDARKYLNGEGQEELSILWEDEDTGLLCKARIDYRSSTALADLKTTEDARQDSFENAIARHGYHRQGAHYQEGWKVLTGELLPFVPIAVEKNSPYAVLAQPLDEEALQVGREERSRLMVEIANALESGKFPGYAKTGTWKLPEWYKRPEVTLLVDGQSFSL